MRPPINKYKIKSKITQYKKGFKNLGSQSKEIAKQVFFPLAIFQLVRTIFFPSGFDVFLLLIIFVIICVLLVDWV